MPDFSQRHGDGSSAWEFSRPAARRHRWPWYALAVGGGSLLVAVGLSVAAIAGKIARGELSLDQGRPRPPAPAAGTANSVLGLDRPTIGDPAAPVAVVEFLDFQCPFCRQAEVVVDQVLSAPALQGKVRFIFRHFPLAEIHPHAVAAARAAECAHRQGQFAPMRRLLFANQTRLAGSDLAGYGRRIGLEPAAFASCLNGDASFAAVEQDWRDGLRLGVKGTPTYFVGGTMIEGAPTFEQLQQAIAAQLTQRQRD